MPFIGLTGNFGMGKTTVLKMFKNLGAYTINADRLVSGLLRKPAIINKLVKIFGREILTKRAGKTSLNKKHIAGIIFNNPKKRILIEKTIHPEVIKTAKGIKNEITAAKPSSTVIFEIPLLFESHCENIFDGIIVVYCSKKTAVRRLLKKGFSKDEIVKRFCAQIPVSRKKTSADFLINNNSTHNDLRLRVHAVSKKLKIK
ncbi:MAG: dephospho-CoA kinase [Nitrospirae bacterium]|nr:dephospho-CoA kinase [Nitrospirota bacterium]